MSLLRLSLIVTLILINSCNFITKESNKSNNEDNKTIKNVKKAYEIYNRQWENERKDIDSVEVLLKKVFEKDSTIFTAWVLKNAVLNWKYDSLKALNNKGENAKQNKIRRQIIKNRERMFENDFLRKQANKRVNFGAIYLLISHYKFLSEVGLKSKAKNTFKKTNIYLDTLNRKGLSSDKLIELVFIKTYLFCSKGEEIKAYRYLDSIKKDNPSLFKKVNEAANNAMYLPEQPDSLDCKKVLEAPIVF